MELAFQRGVVCTEANARASTMDHGSRMEKVEVSEVRVIRPVGRGLLFRGVARFEVDTSSLGSEFPSTLRPTGCIL